MDRQLDPGSRGTQPAWRPLTAPQRRVAGVLVEKAKTTPDAYPLTLHALTSGCNQKSNRSPLMNLSPDDVELALEKLREFGAVVEIQSGSSRVAKYRHVLYEWLGVDKVEMAVMTELLLRGEQTVGELRGRAARMEPIADLNALRPVLKSLIDKGLVVALTPDGRGQCVSHALYSESEMKQVRARCSQRESAGDEDDGESTPASASAPSPAVRPAAEPSGLMSLRHEVAELRELLAELTDRVRTLESAAGTG